MFSVVIRLYGNKYTGNMGINIRICDILIDLLLGNFFSIIPVTNSPILYYEFGSGISLSDVLTLWQTLSFSHLSSSQRC